MSDFFRTTIIVFKKDLISELRTRYALNALIMFVLVSISIIRFAIGEEKVENEILSGLLWIVIFFSASGGLSRTFVKEEEKETSVALKMSVDSSGVFTGKLLFNFVLTLILNFLITVLFIMITDYEIKNLWGFILVIGIGNIGLVSASTIIAAIISKANSKGTLYPVLSFPVLIPLLVTVINATKLSAAGAETVILYEEFVILISYSIVVTTVSLMLFKYVWED
ncbi:MAG TPA: heme exporter protein CcmB [Ignavibacteria bacterium]|nr:heme exporter protein CcmB [Ignavibacteria bacterium]HMR40685.1 heme exporter protein CcmB [Ignavibacteria bacterium]